MNREIFYQELRKRDNRAFGTSLRQSQVDGIEAVLNACIRYRADEGQASYILATAHGETDASMQPVREDMNYSAKRLREVWPSRFPTNEVVKKYAGNPKALANYVYNGRLGNRPGTDDGWNFRGNGIGQITGRDHHETWASHFGMTPFEFVEYLATLEGSADVLVRGMLEGWATGLPLRKFVAGEQRDYYNARRVWNGTFQAPRYAKNAKYFERALHAAGYAPAKPTATPTPTKQPNPATGGLLAALVSLLKSIFGRK